jgi:ribose-phosphate pyrophosphokinase
MSTGHALPLVPKKRLMVFAGRSHGELAQRMAEQLGLELGEVELATFANGETYCRYIESIRGADIFIVQTGCDPVDRNLMELLMMIQAARLASAKRITAVMPLYPYARQDRKAKPREPISGRLVADMLQLAGADRVLTMDLHQGQIQGFFSIPVDELTAINIICAHIKSREIDDIVVVSELGFAKKARNFAELLGAPLAIVEKRRLGNEDRTELMNVIGEVEGKTAVIIDDEIDTAGSLMEAVGALEAEGATDIYACATHGVFSGTALEKIEGSSLREVIVTDTIPLPADATDRITVLSVAPLFGEAIKRIHRGESVGALFSSEVKMVENMTFWDEKQAEDDPDPLRDPSPEPEREPYRVAVEG